MVDLSTIAPIAAWIDSFQNVQTALAELGMTARMSLCSDDSQISLELKAA